MEQVLQKKIQIVDAKPVFIAQLNKNKYIVKGNDGIQYDCWDANWFAQRQLGEWLDIQYSVKQSQGSNGKIYTNYSIVLPKTPQVQPQMTQVNPTEKRLMDRLQIMETNIIDAIRMHCGNDIKVDVDSVPNQFGGIEKANEIGANPNGIPTIEENGDGTYNQNSPF